MMATSFETDGATVLLPAATAMLVEPEKARQAIERDRNIRRSHLYPLFDATAHFACSFLIVPQGCERFDLPRAPWLLVIGDDMHFAWGPKAFHAESLDTAIRGADNCVLITSGPDPYPYRVAATLAGRNRRNVLVIESLPHQQKAWRARIDSIRGENDLPTFLSVPMPVKGTA
jgi:hypothetical protein